MAEELPEPEGSSFAPVYIDKKPDWREVARQADMAAQGAKAKVNT